MNFPKRQTEPVHTADRKTFAPCWSTPWLSTAIGIGFALVAIAIMYIVIDDVHKEDMVACEMLASVAALCIGIVGMAVASLLHV